MFNGLALERQLLTLDRYTERMFSISGKRLAEWVML